MHDAVSDYYNGGTPQPAAITSDLSADQVVARTYVEVIADNEQLAMKELRTLGARQRKDATHLAVAQRAAHRAADALRTSERDASSAQAAQEATLRQVQGQMGVLVAAAQAAQAQAQARTVQSALAGNGQLPARTKAILPAPSVGPGGNDAPSGPVAPAPQATRPVVGTPTPTSPTNHARPPTTTAPPTTAPRTTVPVTTSPPTTPPRTTAPPTTAPPTTTPPTTTPPVTTPGPRAPGWATAIAVAEAQIGKPYQWGAAGPNSYDCSGLVMVAWAAGGVQFPHLAQDQYNMTERISMADILPGDLVFFGTPSNVFHDGIYIGGGEMVDAPETGQNVQIQSIYWSALLGAGRVTG